MSLVSPLNQDDIRKITISRGARTDKGVHALCNILALKLQIGSQYCPTMKGDKTIDKWNIDWENVKININNNLPNSIKIHGIKYVTQSFNVKHQAESRIYSYVSPQLHPNIAFLQEICNQFKGTNNYHNYTSKKDYNDPSSKRFIQQLDVSQFNYNGEYYNKFIIHGNSFMYHQIRKMIGTVFQVIREEKPLSYIKDTFTSQKQSLYVAPQNGLYLREIKFDGYNQKSDIPEKIIIQFSQQRVIDEFEQNLVGEICDEYERTNVFEEWYKEIIQHK